MTSVALRALPRSLLLAVISLLLPWSQAFGQVRILQTNSGGDNIQIIDPVTNKVVGEVKGVPANHGAAASPDGSRFYFSSEKTNTLDVYDGKTLKSVKQIPLTGRPNNIHIARDGRFVYVGIAASPGAIDVIDTVSLERVKSIPTPGGIHNVYVTPDGNHVVAGTIGGRKMVVIDAKTHEQLWTLFDEGVRPIAFETKPDGSTNRLFVQLSNLHGFAVVDWAQRKEVARVTLPEIPSGEQVHPGPYNTAPSHGLGVAPDQKTLWVTSRPNGRVYVYSLPDVKLVDTIKIGELPDWVTFTPDSKFIYISHSGSDDVSAIDVVTRKEVARIKAGPSAKRNITVVIR